MADADKSADKFEMPHGLVEMYRKADLAFLDFCEAQGVDTLVAAINLVRYHRHLAHTHASNIGVALMGSVGKDDDEIGETVGEA